MRTVWIAAFCLALGLALTGGACSHGYLASGSFCMPSSGAADPIANPGNGTCPWGWISSGSYCLRNGRRN